MVVLGAVSGMSEAITNITTAVTAVVGIATSGDLAIFFWAGVLGIGIGVMRKLKH